MSVEGVEILGAVPDDLSHVLTPEALTFIAGLQRQFDTRREELLGLRPARAGRPGERRLRRAAKSGRGRARWRLAGGAGRSGVERPAYRDHRSHRPQDDDQRPEFRAQRSSWSISRIRSRRPGGMCSTASAMCMDAIRRTISFENPDGRKYELNDETATLVIRPRGWHLVERHVTGRWRADLGQSLRFRPLFFHNAKERLAARRRTVLLPAENGELSGSAPLE